MTPRRLPLVLLGSLLATSYFVFHAVFGTHGLQAKSRLLERSTEIERELAVLEAVRIRLRQDVAALGREPPAPDVVEEIARDVLGMIRPGDLIVVRPARSAAGGLGMPPATDGASRH
jgi:cell division protein FtsB